jgi:hypothetical protein
MKSRHGEGAPWYTWRTPGVSNDPSVGISDPVQALERSLTKFGEQARYRERFAAERSKERAEALTPPAVEAEPATVRVLVKQAGRLVTQSRPTSRPLPKFADLGA